MGRPDGHDGAFVLYHDFDKIIIGLIIHRALTLSYYYIINKNTSNYVHVIYVKNKIQDIRQYTHFLLGSTVSDVIINVAIIRLTFAV